MTTIGFIGFGRMGKNMVLHLLEKGVSVVGFNRTIQVTHDFAEEVRNTFFSVGENAATFTPTDTMSDFLEKVPKPRVIFLMIKSGAPVDQTITELLHAGLENSDVIIDGGNSVYTDSIRKYTDLAKHGVKFIDCGTSGGIDGGRYGACLMLGGDRETVIALSTIWDAFTQKSPLAKPPALGGRWEYLGPSGAGHFVKMVHNGIEYGMTQAIGEGMAILEKSPYKFSLPAVVRNWSQGSVIRSWLIDLLARALTKDSTLQNYVGTVGGGESGSWAAAVAQQEGIDVPVLLSALNARQTSKQNPTFSGKVISALRFEYGGHTEGENG